jgi:hypothetical protein
MIFVICLIAIGCKPGIDENIIAGKTFYGDWGDTSWEYEFFKGDTFKFECRGHYSVKKAKGTYFVKEDSLFLMINDSTLKRDGVVNKEYLIDGDSCIIDCQLRYDYCTTRFWGKKR